MTWGPVGGGGAVSSVDGQTGAVDLSGTYAPVAGTPIVRAFPFAFDTPGLLTGAAVYTPTVGDLLMDAWIQIDTAWDGTTPFGDFGIYSGNSGIHGGNGLGPLDMTVGDVLLGTMGTWIGNQTGSLVAIDAILNVPQNVHVNGAGPALTRIPGSGPNGSRLVPSKFIAADPIKVVVSQDGTNVGADPGSTQGAAILYLVTCTPA